MDLEQDMPEPADDEAEAPTEAIVESQPDDSVPESEPRARHDDGRAAVETQARFYQEELERTRRELETMRAAQRQDPRAEQARLEAMDPEQRITYIFEKQQRESQNQVAQIEQRTNAQIDQLKFESELSTAGANLGWSSAQRARYAAEVEAQYNSYAQRNLTIPRAALLRHKLGDELMTSGAKAIKGASDRGKVNIAKQASKMTPASSNVTGKSSGKTKAQESMERMLQAGVLEI